MKNFFLNLKISRKLGLVFLCLLLIMGMGGSVGLYNAMQIAKFSTALHDDYFKRLETLFSIERELLLIRQGMLQHLTVSAKGAKTFLSDSIAEHSKNMDALLKRHIESEKGRVGREEEKLYAGFVEDMKGYMVGVAKAIALSDAGRESDAQALLNNDTEKRFNMTLSALLLLIEEEKNLIDAEYEKGKYFATMITVVTLGFTTAAVFLAVGLWVILSRQLVNPIMTLFRSAEKISSGNLEESVPVLGNDEIGGLAAQFNLMAKNLQGYYAVLEKRVEERTGELKKANETLFRNKHELEVLNEELINASRMKSQFLANISHELRTPLNSIIGFSELLQERSFGDLNQKQSQYVDYIHNGGKHLLDLINNILDLSKIEAGKAELHPEEFDISESIKEILEIIKPIAAKRDVIVESEYMESMMVTAEKSKFKQIMLNLISYAVKFNKKGGRVTVDWKVVEEDDVISLMVSVKDTGIGIKKEDFAKVFKEFEQIDASITREYGGTGLGMALTKKLIELHGGRIWLESEAGKGTTFSFIIPQAVKKGFVKERFEMPIAMPVVPVKEGPPPSILIAGESPDISALLKEYIVHAGYDAHVVSDGIEVIEMAKELKPFAIILGIAIPKKDGWVVIKELKTMPETSGIPVIIVSSSNKKEIGFSLGAVDYMTKPVDKKMLMDSLTRLSFATGIKRRSFTILVIDDEPEILGFVGDILEKEGFGVLKAGGGEEGIGLAIQREPDLIILDLMMPQVSGFDVVERLKQHPIAKDIPIIVFTAKDITKDDKTRLEGNISNILKKASITRDALLDEVRKLEMAYPAKAQMIDPLTGAFNQRYFKRWIPMEVSRSERFGQPFSMLMLDVDNLTNYNANNGFIMGNESLIMITRIIENSLRKADCLVRYNGDAFLIILTETAKDPAVSVGEKLRAKIANSSFPAAVGRKGGKLTVSIGIVGFPVDGRSIEKLIEMAKQAKQDAFERGGNAVVMFKEG